MKIDKDDVVICEVARANTTVRAAVKVEAPLSDSFMGINLSRKVGSKDLFENSTVLANLGPNPKNGWVYGLVISGSLESIETVDGMDLVLKCKPPEGMVDDIKACLQRYARVFGLLKFRMEVHGPRGNRLGFWATHKRGDAVDVMGIHTTAYLKSELDETMTHETGHGVWNRLITEQFRARFIEAYTKSIAVHSTSLDEVQKMAKKFDDFAGTVRSFAKTLQRSEKKVFVNILRWIKEVHHITKEDVDKLRMGEFSVVGYFPSHHIVTSSVMPVITQYGTTKPVEFFCEAWAHYWVGKPMPATVVEIIHELCHTLGIEDREGRKSLPK